VFDTVNAAEDITAELSAAGDLIVSVNDSVTIAENVDTDGIPNISVDDNIIIAESVDRVFELLYIDINDTVDVAENIAIDGIPNINVSDSVTVDEDVTINVQALVTDLDVNISDDITVTEYINLSLYIPFTEIINLYSPIVTQVNLNSKIVDVITLNSKIIDGIKNPVLEFSTTGVSDGNWYNLPVFLGNDWEIEFDIFMIDPGFAGQNIQCVFGFGSTEAGNSSYINLHLSRAAGFNLRIEWIYQDGLDSGTWKPAFTEVSNEWNHIKYTKIGTSHSITMINSVHTGAGKTESTTLDDNFDFNKYGLGAVFNLVLGGDLTRLNSYDLQDGTKIKNLSGSIWKFGKAYTSITLGTDADIGDDVGAITNIAGDGGLISQSTTTDQALFESVEGIKSVLNLDSELS